MVRQIKFQDGGLGFLEIENVSSGNVSFNAQVQDKDIVFTGNDGGSAITALSLDMSDGGVATFNAGAQFGGNVLWPDNQKILVGTGADLQIYHDGTHSYFKNSHASGSTRFNQKYFEVNNTDGTESMLSAYEDGAVTLRHNGSTKFETTADGVTVTGGAVMGGTIVGSGTSNTVGAASALRLGESNFRIMTGGEQHVLCLDRDNAGGTKYIMQSWNPDSGDVAIGSAAPVAAGRLMIKPTSLTQAQLKLQGLNYSYGTELHSQNGSEGGTVGNTRQFFKIEHVTNGYTRTMYTTSSQIGTDTHTWKTNNSTKMFLHDYGKLDLNSEATQWNLACYAGGTGTQYFIDFRLSNNTQVGHIDTNGSSVTYATSSDYRLKENVDYTWDATTRLKQLKPARFNFIADDTNTLVDGFLAHEVSSIVPEAVTGAKDAMTAAVLYVEADDLPEGKSVGDVKEASVPDMQGIDQSKLVPLLVKTIQELEARITALEA